MKKLQSVLGACSIICQAYCSDITFINSDSTTYSNESVCCTGHVIIVYHGRIIAADKVYYDQNNTSIRATGNVIIEDEHSNIYFADSLYIEKDFTIGYAENIKIITNDKSRLAATSCSINHRIFELHNAIYSPCYVCTESGKITWQIKAEYVKFDPNSYTCYDNATLEVFGVPSIYIPHFSHVTPTLKRKTGLLSPKITTNSHNGFCIVLPYLASTSESHELILKPIITSKVGAVAWGRYDVKFAHGELNIDTSATGTSSVKNYSVSNYNVQKIQDSGYRGHIFSSGRYEFSDTWRGGFDINLVSDNFYLKRFPLIRESNRTLESNAKLERFDNRSYTLIKTAMFQGETSDTAPKILPIIEHNYSVNLPNGVLNIDSTLMNLLFHHSRSARKTVINPSWNKRLLFPFGNILDISALVSLQMLNVSEKKHSDYDSACNIIPQLKCMWQWPLLLSSAGYSTILTPIVGTVIASSKKNIDIFEDQFSDINDINLSEGYRSSSSYNIDTGRRIFYGTRCASYRNGEPLYRLTIGQSYEFTSVPNRLSASGLKYKHSNIVSSMDVFLSDKMTLMYSGSYSPKERYWSKFETGINFTHNNIASSILGFNGRHCLYDPFVTNPVLNEKQNTQRYKGIALHIDYQVSSTFALSAEATFGNKGSTSQETNQPIKLVRHNVGFKYQNECTYITLHVERKNYRSGDLQPDTSIRLVVHLRNLGN